MVEVMAQAMHDDGLKGVDGVTPHLVSDCDVKANYYTDARAAALALLDLLEGDA
jgi:hypothetical protein